MVINSKVFAVITSMLLVVGGLSPFTGHSNIGFLMILIGVVINDRIPKKKDRPSSHLSLFGFFMTFIWTWGVIGSGMNGQEFIQFWCLIAGSINWLQHWRNKYQLYPIIQAIVIFNLVQILLSGLLAQWSLSLVLTAGFSVSLWQYNIGQRRTRMDAVLLWSAFLGIRSVEIYLRGGLFIDSPFDIYTAHEKWIMMLSAPILGTAIFQTFRSILAGNLAENEEE
jgi:hypothetical protein